MFGIEFFQKLRNYKWIAGCRQTFQIHVKQESTADYSQLFVGSKKAVQDVRQYINWVRYTGCSLAHVGRSDKDQLSRCRRRWDY